MRPKWGWRSGVPPFKISHFPQQSHTQSLINTEIKIVNPINHIADLLSMVFQTIIFLWVNLLDGLWMSLFLSLNDVVIVHDCTLDCCKKQGIEQAACFPKASLRFPPPWMKPCHHCVKYPLQHRSLMNVPLGSLEKSLWWNESVGGLSPPLSRSQKSVDLCINGTVFSLEELIFQKNSMGFLTLRDPPPHSMVKDHTT